MDPNRAALPLSRWVTPTRLSIGTGFLGRKGKEICLFTVAHIMDNSLQMKWEDWPAELDVYSSTDRKIPVPLFQEIDGKRTPLFSFVPLQETDELNDMVAIDHSSIEGELSHLHVCDLDAANHAPLMGESVLLYGFPHLDPTRMWPSSSPYVVHGRILRGNDDYMFEAQMDRIPEPGFSGGAFFDSRNRFIGMLIGFEGPMVLIAPAAVLGLLI